MAAAYALATWQDRSAFADWQVASAGIFAMPGQAASEGAQRVAAENGLNLQDHRSQSLTAAHLAVADVVLTMTAQQAAALAAQFPAEASKIRPLADHDIIDPFGGSDDLYRLTYADIAAAVDAFTKEREESL